MNRKIMLAALIATGLVVNAPALARDCKNAITTSELNECAYDDYMKADKELNAEYQSLRNKLDETGKEILRDAQRAWIPFRDAECMRVTDPFRGGTLHKVAYNACRSHETLKRIEQLRENTGLVE
nr:lysozyme inhibitor LprI family protein [uncultured Cohaesibacter sp.]